jgi:carbonic anhydrase
MPDATTGNANQNGDNARAESASVPDPAPPPESPSYSYSGATSPPHWASLSEEYATCNGDAQSPVDIVGVQPGDALAPLRVAYATSPAQVNLDGHLTQVDLDAPGHLHFQGRRYALEQFHFHTPSEHTRAGRHFPAEAHLVHAGDGGDVAVVGVWVKEGAENAMLHRLLTGAGAQADASRLLPGDRSYYTYTGSLTTPPCTEGVRWIFMQEPISLSPRQIEALKGECTNRPVQPLNGRSVLDYEE